MRTLSIIIRNKVGERLSGIVSKPNGVIRKCPTILLVHGFGVTKEENGLFDELTYILCEKNNFIVYRFDFSGCGSSDGDYSKTTLTKLVSDLESIINYVIRQSYVDKNKFGIMAQSFGTSVVVATKYEPTAMVLTGSIANPKRVLSSLFRKDYNPDGISHRLRSDGSTTYIENDFWRDLDNYDLIKNIQNITCPILFIHGSDDTHVPISEMDNFFNNYHKTKECIIVDGNNHGFEPNKNIVYGHIIEWFKKYL